MYGTARAEESFANDECYEVRLLCYGMKLWGSTEREQKRPEIVLFASKFRFNFVPISRKLHLALDISSRSVGKLLDYL